MSLKKNIENAFLKTIGYDDIEDRESKSLMKEKAETFGSDVSSAIVDFLQTQEFTITKMKAIVALDEIKTSGKLSADLSNRVQYMIPAGVFATSALVPAPPVPISPMSPTNKAGVDVPKLDLKRRGGQGGTMNAVGYAYVGRNNPVSPSESGEDDTIVKLIDVKDD